MVTGSGAFIDPFTVHSSAISIFFRTTMSTIQGISVFVICHTKECALFAAGP